MDILARMNPAFANVRRIDFGETMRLTRQGLTMMGWADPFYPDPCLPAHVIEATKAALDEGKTHYTVPVGSLDLRRAIVGKLKTYNGLTVDPETEMVITPGSDTGLYYAMQVLIAPGDEVLNPEPSYGSNHVNTLLMGATSVQVPLRESAGYQLDVEDLEARLSPRTKAIVLTQPNNPTGTVHSRETLEALARFAIANDLFVVADHAFESTVFDGRELVTIAALPGMWERTISVFSTSKGMGMSGYRIGYNVACAPIMTVMHSAAVNVMGAPNSFAQAGAIAAFANDAFIEDFTRVFDGRRKVAFERLNAVAGVRCLMPEAGFMIWVNVAALGASKDVVRHLIEDARVIVGSGAGYGPSGEGYIRIMLGSLRDEAAFEDALDRIVAALGRLAARRGLVAGTAVAAE